MDDNGQSADLTLTVNGGNSDALHSLYGFLVEESDLRGRVRVSQQPPKPGTLGPVMDAVLVSLGPGGVAMATASVLIAWIRRSAGEQTVMMTKPDGSTLTVTSTNVRNLDAAGARALTEQLSHQLQELDAKDHEDGGCSTS